MTLFQLFSDCKVDGVARVSDFDGVASQNAYYDSLERYSFYADFVNVGEPILISQPLDVALTYRYGRMKIREMWYYFSIDNALPDTEGTSWMKYTIDAWETARYQMGARLGKGIVSRMKLASSAIHPRQPYQPVKTFNVRIPMTADETVYKRFEPWFLAYCHFDDTNKEGIYAISSVHAGDILTGNWIKELGLLSGNVQFCGLSPFKPKGFKPTVDPLGAHFSKVDELGNMVIRFETSRMLYTDDTHEDSITDMRGNEVFAVPFGVTMNKAVEGFLNMSATAGSWDLKLTDTDGNEYRVNIPLEPVDVFIDQYTEYFARQRDQDIATRKLQIREAKVKGEASNLTNVLSGAVGGAMTGNVFGALGGTILGGVTGVASNYISNNIDVELQPRYQAQVDWTYYKAKDELSLSGTLPNSLIIGQRACMVSSYDWDAFSAERFNAGVEAFGYAVDLPVSSGETYYKPGPFAGDFEISGVPDEWKAQIKTRFLGGVTIVD